MTDSFLLIFNTDLSVLTRNKYFSYKINVFYDLLRAYLCASIFNILRND